MKKYSKKEQLSLAVWAGKCAKHVLPFFRKEFPGDSRPDEALKTLQKWIRTGDFQMQVIRKASLDSHAAARNTIKQETACFAARAAGQAVATPHVPQHAWGAGWYALKAVAALTPEEGDTEKRIQRTEKEFHWQLSRLPPSLREEYSRRIGIHKSGKRVIVSLDKSGNF